jgi:hypothetical protein
MAISITAAQVSTIGAQAGLDSVSADPTQKKAAPGISAQPQVQVDTVVVGTVNEDALRALDASSGGEAARTARSNIGVDGAAPRIGAMAARQEIASTTVQGSGSMKG